MPARVIQGFFIGGGMHQPRVLQRLAPASAATMPGVAAGRALAGPPPPSFGGRTAVQRRVASGRPAPVHAPHAVAQPFGDEVIEIDPSQLRLANGRGTALPGALLAKMEVAFGADFSGVRVHVGPQASQIGALAFTTGNDLYFAPGQYRPETVRGQQLIGHELAHVIQQRQGRVRGSGSGLSVVQDRVLEAEADRMGMRAANHRVPVQAKATASGLRPMMAAPPGLVHAAAIQLKKGKKGPNPVRAAAALRVQNQVVAPVIPANSQTHSGAPVTSTSTGGATSKGGGVTAELNGETFLGVNMSKTENHAEAQICKAWKDAVAKIKHDQGEAKALEASKVARSFSINAWPCATCDERLVNTARDLGCKITVTVTNDYGLYSKDHDFTAGLKGTITYG
jgi:hypothetical protein